MTAERIYVVARFEAGPGQVEAVRRVLMGLLDPTRREAGCIRYDLLQSPADPAEFVFDEEWESGAHLDAHLGTPHVAAAVAAVQPLVVRPPDIRRYRRIG
ncbi:MAG: antibiotic biosynthesis monooxygenase [Acidobacteriota bacterium]|nr:antibiotic biosynthesis monooxygenase [Acidobacteriota bacterium]